MNLMDEEEVPVATQRSSFVVPSFQHLKKVKNVFPGRPTLNTKGFFKTSTFQDLDYPGSGAMCSSSDCKREANDFCGNSSETDPLVENIRFWVSGVCVAVVGSFGLIGNLLSLVTIATMMKKSLFNKLLLTLTIYDTIFISNAGLFMAQQSLNFKSEIYNYLFPTVIYPLAGFSMTGSTYTCIAIALERYLGIVYAHSFGYGRRTRYYVVAILLITIVIDFPRFLEIDAERDRNGQLVAFVYSKIRKSKYYIKMYTVWFRLIATAVIPFSMMLFFNLRILFYHKKNSFTLNHSVSNHRGSTQNSGSHVTPPPAIENDGSNQQQEQRAPQPTVSPHSHSHSNTSGHERTLLITFFWIATIFVICHMPRIFLNIYEVKMSQDREICKAHYKRQFISPRWVLVVASFEKLFLIINSSLNFVIYCLAGKGFRQQMCNLLFRRLSCGLGRSWSHGSNEGDQRTIQGYKDENATNTAGGTATTGLVQDLESVESRRAMRSSLSHSRPRAKLMLVSQITADDERVVDLPALAEELSDSINEVKPQPVPPNSPDQAEVNVADKKEMTAPDSGLQKYFLISDTDDQCFSQCRCAKAVKLNRSVSVRSNSNHSLHSQTSFASRVNDIADENNSGTYSCSSLTSKSSVDPRCPKCYIMTKSDNEGAVFV